MILIIDHEKKQKNKNQNKTKKNKGINYVPAFNLFDGDKDVNRFTPEGFPIDE